MRECAKNLGLKLNNDNTTMPPLHTAHGFVRRLAGCRRYRDVLSEYKNDLAQILGVHRSEDPWLGVDMESTYNFMSEFNNILRLCLVKLHDGGEGTTINMVDHVLPFMHEKLLRGDWNTERGRIVADRMHIVHFNPLLGGEGREAMYAQGARAFLEKLDSFGVDMSYVPRVEPLYAPLLIRIIQEVRFGIPFEWLERQIRSLPPKIATDFCKRLTKRTLYAPYAMGWMLHRCGLGGCHPSLIFIAFTGEPSAHDFSTAASELAEEMRATCANPTMAGKTGKVLEMIAAGGFTMRTRIPWEWGTHVTVGQVVIMMGDLDMTKNLVLSGKIELEWVIDYIVRYHWEDTGEVLANWYFPARGITSWTSGLVDGLYMPSHARRVAYRDSLAAWIASMCFRASGLRPLPGDIEDKIYAMAGSARSIAMGARGLIQ